MSVLSLKRFAAVKTQENRFEVWDLLIAALIDVYDTAEAAEAHAQEAQVSYNEEMDEQLAADQLEQDLADLR